MPDFTPEKAVWDVLKLMGGLALLPVLIGLGIGLCRLKAANRRIP